MGTERAPFLVPTRRSLSQVKDNALVWGETKKPRFYRGLSLLVARFQEWAEPGLNRRHQDFQEAKVDSREAGKMTVFHGDSSVGDTYCKWFPTIARNSGKSR